MTYFSKKGFVHSIAMFIVGLLLLAPTTLYAFNIENLNDVEVRNDFVLGPGKTELFLEPGESQGRELIITNRTGRAVEFLISVEDFVGSRDPEQTTILLGEEVGPYSLRDYVVPEINQFVLEHGQRARVGVRVNVPFDAEPGGRYGAVLVSAQPPQEERDAEAGAAQGGTRIVTRLGTLFFVRVDGDVVENGMLQGIDTIGGSMFSSGPIPFQILYENTGTVHVNPYGIVEITNILGRTVGEIEVDPWFALPDSLRFREISWGKEFLFGRYTAHAQINRGYGDIIDEAAVVFWVVPWPIIAGGFIGLILIILFFRWILGRFEIRRKP